MRVCVFCSICDYKESKPGLWSDSLRATTTRSESPRITAAKIRFESENTTCESLMFVVSLVCVCVVNPRGEL